MSGPAEDTERAAENASLSFFMPRTKQTFDYQREGRLVGPNGGPRAREAAEREIVGRVRALRGEGAVADG